MANTFNPNDFKQAPSFDPSKFETPPDKTPEAPTFQDQVVNLDDLPDAKKEEYAQFLKPSPAIPEDAEIGEADESKVTNAFNTLQQANKITITDDMRETFIRALMSNTSYEQTYKIHEDLSVSFRTLTVKEYDAIADAIGKLSEEAGFVNTNHLKFINYRYTVSSAITKIETKDAEGAIQIINYVSPLLEDPATHREEIMQVKQLDGSLKERTKTVPITDADRVLAAHEDRFNNVNSVLYNVFLNTYDRFDREVNTLAAELYQKNFTAPLTTTSFS